ncbi:MAG TPA: hypothetical protein VER55_16245, partial [Ardenticatenaceae bacterium]|nr:hypothetical protein [Ardenticatenaceae bacterium]
GVHVGAAGVAGAPAMRANWLPRVVVALLTLAGWASLRAPAPVFPVDDAYIHLVYARHLAAGEGLVYNLGEPSIGTSSPLWTLLLVPVLASDFPVFPLVEALNAALLVILAWLVSDLAALLVRTLAPTMAEERLAWLAAVAAVAFNGNLLWLAHAGMETILYLVLGVATIRLFARQGASATTMLVAGLFVLTRFPGVLLPALLLVWDIARGAPLGRRLRVAWLAALPYIPLGLHSLAVSGSFFPTTLKGKLLTHVAGGHDVAAEIAFLAWIWDYLSALVPATWLVLIPTVGGLLAWGWSQRARWRGEAVAIVVVTAGWGVGEVALHTIFFRSWWHHLRYLAPIFPVVAVLAPLGLLALLQLLIALNRRLTTLLTRRPAGNARYSGLRVAWSLAVAGVVVAGGLQQLPRWQTLYRKNVEQIARVHVAAGDWLATHSPPNARVATFDIGAIAFESQRHVVDLGGLLDPASHAPLAARDLSSYMLDRGASYWVDLEPVSPTTPDFSGLRERRGSAFSADPLIRFEVPHYYDPVHPASLALTIYAVRPPARVSVR